MTAAPHTGGGRRNDRPVVGPGRRRLRTTIALVVALAVAVLLTAMLVRPSGDAGGAAASGYVLRVSFAPGAPVVADAAVRVAGVPVGTVRRVGNDPASGRTTAELVLQRRFAPVPTGTRAVLRSSSLLEAPYVALDEGPAGADPLPDGGRLPVGRVSQAVDVDRLLAGADPATRRAVGEALRRSAKVLRGHGGELSAAIGGLSPFARDGATLLRTLDAQQAEVARLVRDGGTVAGALGARRGELSGLLADADRLLAIGDRRGRDLAASVEALPGFEREARRTVERLTELAADSDPLVAQLRPAARELAPAIEAVAAVAPDAARLVDASRSLVAASRRGLPALTRIGDALRPALGAFEPLLRELTPAWRLLAQYPDETRAFFANGAASLQASAPDADGKRRHYLRVTTPINLENLAIYDRRLSTNRPDPYAQPGGARTLAGGMPVFEDRQCDREPLATGFLTPLNEALGGPLGTSASACRRQPGYVAPNGRRSDFPQVERDPADGTGPSPSGTIGTVAP